MGQIEGCFTYESRVAKKLFLANVLNTRSPENRIGETLFSIQKAINVLCIEYKVLRYMTVSRDNKKIK